MALGASLKRQRVNKSERNIAKFDRYGGSLGTPALGSSFSGPEDR